MKQSLCINTVGLEEIKSFLQTHHKKREFTDAQIRAWASDAENAPPPIIEIKSWDAVSGHTETLQISDDGQDWGEVWEAWEDGKRDDAQRFFVPEAGPFDVAQRGAEALGVDVSDTLNVARVRD